MKKFFLILFLLTALTPAMLLAEETPLVLTVKQLLENPTAYNEQVVTVRGYMRIQNEGWLLYASPNSVSFGYQINANILMKRELYDRSMVEITGTFMAHGAWVYATPNDFLLRDITSIERLPEGQQIAYEEIKDNLMGFNKETILDQTWEPYAKAREGVWAWVQAIQVGNMEKTLKKLDISYGYANILKLEEVTRELNREGSRINWALFSGKLFDFNKLKALTPANFSIISLELEDYDGEMLTTFSACFCREETCQGKWPINLREIITVPVHAPFMCVGIKEIGDEWLIEYYTLMPFPG